jgi:hypothetical protein
MRPSRTTTSTFLLAVCAMPSISVPQRIAIDPLSGV